MRNGQAILGDMRIYLHDNSNAFRLCLFGELNQTASLELERCWLAALSIVEAGTITIDATGVTAIQEEGTSLLKRIARSGARITVSRLAPAAALLGSLGNAIEVTGGERTGSFLDRARQMAAGTRLRRLWSW